MNLKEQYFKKANYLMEQPEEDEPELGQAEQIEIYFDNLDEETQKIFMNAIRNELKVTEDDKYGNQKIIEALAKKPITSIRTEEVVRTLNIDI